MYRTKHERREGRGRAREVEQGAKTEGERHRNRTGEGIPYIA